MAKDDVPALPNKVPRNRRQVQAILDVHLAMWLYGDTLTPGERKKLQAEKDRRKQQRPELVLGVVCGNEGATPEQVRKLREVLPRIAPTKINQVPLPSKLNYVIRALVREQGLEQRVFLRPNVGVGEHMLDVVRESNTLVAIQKETTVQEIKLGDHTRGVASAIGLARHRGIPVRVILPNGEEVKL